MRVILYTGKGGVGKTTLSAATAVASAEQGHRTVVLSTDAAHSLGDALDVRLPHEPTSIAKNLWAFEVDVHHELSKNWKVISAYIKRFLTSQGYDEVVAEELAIMPGMEELFSLLKLLELEKSGLYDVAIIDCAPTGSTLQFLAFSDVIDWYMTRFFHLERRLVKAVKPIAEKVIKAPLPTDEVFYNVEGIYQRVVAIKEMLTDPVRSTVRLVSNPEKMAVAESRRAFVALSLHGFPVDAVVANRVLPKEAGKGYFANWMKTQKANLDEIKTFFSPVPTLTCPYYDREMLGLDNLRLLASDVFTNGDAAAVLHSDRPFLLETDENGLVQMKIKLPGVEKDDIDLWIKEDELIITVQGRRRNILLPRALQELALQKAKLNEGVFCIEFGRRGS